MNNYRRHYKIFRIVSLITAFFMLVALPLGGISIFGKTVETASASGPVDLWVPTWDLTNFRANHIGALLPDGRVLVAGGYNGSYLKSAEIYNPATGRWVLTDEMNEARRGHRSAQLPDGRVVVSGGWFKDVQSKYYKSTEIYDPGSGTWSETGEMNEKRYYHTMTTLKDGRILAVGGYWREQIAGIPDPVFHFLKTAEIFDPVTGIWTLTGSMAYARSAHTATLLPDGRVLIAGGWSATYPRVAEIYDPNTGTFSPVGSLNKGRSSHTATLLPDGQVMVAGGISANPDGSPLILDTAEIYNPESDDWTYTNHPMNAPREFHTATLIPDGRVLVAGGNDLNSAEIFNPADGTWSPIDDMEDRRESHVAILLNDGRVMVAGGLYVDPDDPSVAPVLYGVELYQTNLLPVSVQDNYDTEEDVALNIAVEDGVLSNDSDQNDDPLTVSLVQPPAQGTLDLIPDGSFLYTPVPNVNGTDEFSYQVCDNWVPAGCSTSQVTINVSPVQDLPLVEGESEQTFEDTPLTRAAPGLLANDEEVDGETLSSALNNEPQHGTASVNPDGSFVYTPYPDYFGADEFTYDVCDSASPQGCSTGKIVLDVLGTQDLPITTNDDYATIAEETLTVDAPGVLGNDLELDDELLHAVPGTSPLHGDLVLNANGSFEYTPELGYVGEDSFTYQACDTADPEGCTYGTVTIAVTVLEENNAPVANDDSYSAVKNKLLEIDVQYGVLENDTDLDSDPLKASLEVGFGPEHGTLTLNNDGSFLYTPEDEYLGTDAFQYKACDDGLPVKCDTATVTIYVTEAPLNHNPNAHPDSYTTLIDSPLEISAEAGVLANDTDIDGDTLSATLDSTPEHGTVTIGTDGSFVYTPATGYTGTDTFTYWVEDDATPVGRSLGTVTIEIKETDDHELYLPLVMLVLEGQ